jgi:glycosyltransferase involved in cell wall biosynthesis
MLPRRGIFRSQFPEIGDAFLILFLGRLNFKKGLDLLAKSYGIVARQCQAVHLVIAGPDNEGYGQRVRQWLTDEGVLHRATFTGMLLGQDKLAALSDADVFVLPSYSENWGVAVVEAMACGLPVVISDQVNLWQEVAKAEAGLVIPCDPQKLSDALLQLQHDAELREKLGANGRRLAAKFSWNSAASQMLDVYEKYGHRV